MASLSFEQTLKECEAMLKYARSYNRPIRPQVQSDIELIKIQREQIKHQIEANRQLMEEEANQKEKERKVKEQEMRKMPRDPSSLPKIKALGDAIESLAMNAKKLRMEATAPRSAESFCVPPSENLPSEEELVQRLSDIHSELANAIAPATPSAVLIMDETARSGFFRFLGPVPLVRRMMIVTLICLVAFLSLFLSPHVNSISIGSDILNIAEWDKFLLNELVIVMAAALGASFYNLFEAYKYVSTASFDSKYESIYWVRFTLGIVSGVILSQFIFSSPPPPDSVNAIQNMPDGATGQLLTYKPLLSFLGGFSARVVHKILNSLVDGVETFVSGSTRDMLKVREAAAKVKLEDTISAIKQENATQQTASRLHSALELTQLQQRLNAGMDNIELKTTVEQMINGLVSPVNGQSMFGNVTTNNGGIPQDFPPTPDFPVQPVGPEHPNTGGEFNPNEFINIPDVPSGYDNPPSIGDDIPDVPPVIEDNISGINITSDRGVDTPPSDDDQPPKDA